MTHRARPTTTPAPPRSATQAATRAYRYDLDGLRGIAIALVVIFHVFVGRVSGGVDVFLLLSGYFFLGSQLRYAGKDNASLNPWWPIWRTIRRLVPALFLTLGVTALLVTFVARNLGTGELYKQFTASVLYYQNWELTAQNADYTAASASTSPLQHLWSMAVQGQFYVAGIAFSLILAMVWKTERLHREAIATSSRGLKVSLDGQQFVFHVAGPILIAVTIASFIYASRHGFFGTPQNYYSTFSRAWELTLGAVLAIYGSRIKLDERMSVVASVAGLFMIVITGFVITDTTAFPGPLTLLPLSGAALVIIGGASKANPVSDVLSRGVFRWLGDIAYSLYLWHWPLLIVATAYLQQQRPSMLLGVAIIAVSLGLAHVTNRWVEKPLAQHRKRPVNTEKPVATALAQLRSATAPRGRALAGVAVAVVAVVLLGMQPRFEARVADAEQRAQSFNPADYPGALALTGAHVPELPYQPDPTLVGKMHPLPTQDGCNVARETPGDFFAEVKKNGEPCVYGDVNSDVTVVLTGGSHAEQWFSPINELGKEYGFKLIALVRQDCAIMIEEPNVDPNCTQWSQLATDRIIAMQPDLVISTSTRPEQRGGFGQDIVPASYTRFWDQLSAANLPTIALRDNPWATENGNLSDLSMCLALTDDVERCTMPRSQVYAEPNPTDAFASAYPLVDFIDTSDWFCPAGVCPPVIGNVVVYRDQNHISEPYATSLKPSLWRIIGPKLRTQLDAYQRQEAGPEVASIPETTLSTPPSAVPSAPAAPAVVPEPPNLPAAPDVPAAPPASLAPSPVPQEAPPAAPPAEVPPYPATRA